MWQARALIVTGFVVIMLVFGLGIAKQVKHLADRMNSHMQAIQP